MRSLDLESSFDIGPSSVKRANLAEALSSKAALTNSVLPILDPSVTNYAPGTSTVLIGTIVTGVGDIMHIAKIAGDAPLRANYMLSVCRYSEPHIRLEEK